MGCGERTRAGVGKLEKSVQAVIDDSWESWLNLVGRRAKSGRERVEMSRKVSGKVVESRRKVVEK